MFRTHELPQFFFAGSSDQEKAAQKSYDQISGYNPTVKNRYNNMNLFGYKDMSGAADKYTKAGEGVIKQQTLENVKDAGKSTAAAGQSRGYGGSILEDMIAKAKTGAAKGGTSALKDLMLKRLGMVPGMMQQDNANKFGQTAGATGVDMSNVQNMFGKFGMQNNAIAGLSDDTWFTDMLALANTAGGFIP